MNNNPFSCQGEISRMSFIVTTLVLLVPTSILLSMQNLFYRKGADEAGLVCALLILFCVLLAIFACAKRFRNIGKNPYLSILFVIPLVCVVLWFYLAIKTPKQNIPISYNQ